MRREISRFAREASEGATGLLHRITKARAVWCPREAAQGEAANPRDAADLAAKSWASIWRTQNTEMQGADRPWEVPSTEDASELPQLAVEGPTGFAAVVSSFKPETGIGVDAIHPSAWSRISDKGKHLFTGLLHEVELTLTWPAQIQTLIYFLVPKTPTGERPIGLMPSIVRVWERMRKPVMDQWLVSQSRSYDWTCRGRSAELAAWQHLVLQEGQGCELGTGRATALLDMTKCFEQVRLWHVWRWGCHWDFPRGLLRVILLVFSFQCRVGLWGATSEPTQTYAAIIAGSVFSCAILHMLFIWPCDCLMSKWPRLRLTKYVDDITISYSGRNYAVADTITEATSLLIGWLESGLDFHVSKDENGKGRQVCGPGLEPDPEGDACGQGEAVRHEGGFSRSALGRRLVWGWCGETPQDAVWTVGWYQEENAQGQVLQEIWCGYEQNRQGRLPPEWLTRCAMFGPSSNEGEGAQNNHWTMPPRASTQDVRSPGAWLCTSATRFKPAG